MVLQRALTSHVAILTRSRQQRRALRRQPGLCRRGGKDRRLARGEGALLLSFMHHYRPLPLLPSCSQQIKEHIDGLGEGGTTGRRRAHLALDLFDT